MRVRSLNGIVFFGFQLIVMFFGTWTQVKWADNNDGYGEQYWEYNHGNNYAPSYPAPAYPAPAYPAPAYPAPAYPVPAYPVPAYSESVASAA